MINTIGVSIPRKEAFDKVTGTAKYTDDFIHPGVLHAKMLTSIYAHANIKSIDVSEALNYPGVQAVITGDYFPTLCGTVIEDRPPIARGKVRYYGEPVAVVVANSEQQAMNALKLIKVQYEPLPVINSVSEALNTGAMLVHENLVQYTRATKDVLPQPNTNIVDTTKIRKGDIFKGFAECEFFVEGSYSLPQSDHIAMETRNVRAQILPGGQVIIYTSSQAPFEVKKMISKHYNVPEGDIVVIVPFVGGGFGGKSPIQLEFIAYLASKAVGGRPVKIANTREEDIRTSPCKVGLEAKVKIGATRDGIIKAFEATYLVDAGAYADIGPRIAKSAAMNCTGPYDIENVWCDSLTVYTNHTYVTAYRGFGHICSTFCVERTLDKLASLLRIDPLELRIKNAIIPGCSSPTQAHLNESNAGNLTSCLVRIKELTNWNEGTRIETNNKLIKAKGMACFWKTSNSPTNAISGVILTFNGDGSININCGAVEIGPGMKTTIAQILAEKMQMDVSRIYVKMDVDTRISPVHWKTVASMTTFMMGRAVIRAAEDLIKQLLSLAAIVMKCPPDDLEVGNEKVFLKDDPNMYVSFKEIVHSYKYPDGSAIEGQITAHGSYVMRHITHLNKETGRGKPGPSWSVGAQVVEVEYDPNEFTYRVLKATTVMDAGKIINPKTAQGLIMGGVSMGLGLGSREEFIYDSNAILQTTSLRTYKVMHIGENPEYVVDFIETPQIDGPFGARGLAEHGILGIPPALANALSLAAQAEFDKLPITSEVIWKTKTGGKYDTI